MADESTSVGKVQLDIEISQSSLNREMNKLGSVFNSSLKNMFGQTTNFVKSSLERMTNSFKTFSQVGAGSTNKVSGNINKLNSDLEKTQARIDETNSKLAQLYAEQDNIMQSYRDMPAFSGMGRDESLEQMLNADSRFSSLTSEIEGLESRLQQLRTASDTTGSSIRNLQENLSSTNNTTQRTNDTTRRAADTTRRFGREINKTGQNAKKSTGKITGFANMIDSSFRRILKRIFIYNLIYKGIRGIIKYTGDALKTNKQFVHSLNVIKTNLMVAFQPIYDFILPAINALMKGIATVTTYVASAISSLFGKTYEQSYGATENLDNAKKAMDGYGKSAKKAQSQVAGFDEITQLDLGEDDEDEASGFEMTMPDMSTIDMTGIERFKEMMADILKPFKLAWDIEGLNVIDTIKSTLESVKGLIGAIGDSWRVVWTNGTGQAMLETVLRIAQNILNIVGNLATAFKNAWEKNEVGTRITQEILDIFSIILETIRRITEVTAQWAEKLNFYPLLESINGLLGALEPLTQNIGDGLVWFWENALLPITGWVVEDALPVFLDILAEAIRILNGVIEALKPLGQWLWDNFLKPLADWTGGVIVSVLNGIKDALKSIGDWMRENQTTVENIAIAIGSFMLAWKIVELALLIKGIVTALFTFISTGGLATLVTTGLGAAIAFLTSPITIAIAIIGALIAIGVLLYKNWDEISAWLKKIWEDIKIKAEEIWTAIKEFFVRTWDGIKTTAINVWDNIKTYTTTKWNEIKEFLSKLWDGIKESFKRVWESMKELLPSLLDGILNVMKNSFDTFKDIGYNLFNMVWEGMKDIWNSINGWVTDKVEWLKDKMSFWKKGTDEMSSSGGGGGSRGTGGVAHLADDHPDKPGSEEYKKNNPNMPAWLGGGGIPKLARGGIVDQPTLAMVGERGKEAVVPLENTAFVDTLASALGNAVMAAMQMSNGGGSGTEGSGETILQIDGTTLGRILGPILDKERQRMGNNAVIQPI